MRRSALVVTTVVLAASLAVGAPPGEVPPDAHFEADGETWSWSPVPDATSYNVYRGIEPASHDQACRVYLTSGLSSVLPEVPGAAGELFYFLVSAVGPDGEGELGTGAAPRPNDAPCVDSDGDLLADNLDNCPADANPSQADQDANAVGDRCDPRTYDFEADPPGTRPAGMLRLGSAAQSLTVKDLAGDHAVSYDQPGAGVHDRFERLLAPTAFQDTVAYLDVDAGGGTASLELWSEGSFAWNAGGGILLQVDGSGSLVFRERYGRDLATQAGPSLPPGGRMRLRLVKGAGSISAVHVDSWDGTGWLEDWAVFPVDDDHRLAGLGSVLADHDGGSRAVRRITVAHTAPSEAIALSRHPSWSTDWKVFQRDGADRAIVPLRFHYRLDGAGRVQARVVEAGTLTVLPGHDWPDHEKALAAANGALETLDVAAVPAGGNYDVEIRLIRNADGAILGDDRLFEIGVGDVFLAGGQSNMSGYSGNLTGAEEPIDQVHLFHNDYRWRRASEPMDDGTDQVDRVSQESPLHSLMLRFAKELHGATGVPFGIIPGPLGGTNLYAQWQRNESDHEDRGTLYGSLLHRALVQSDPQPPRGLLWYQGESDAGRGTELYKADLEQLIARYREDLESPDLFVGVVQLATYDFSSLATWLPIQEAQRQVAEEDARVTLVAAVDLPRSDSIHLNVDGYKTVGRRLALEAMEHLYAMPVDASARLVQARSASVGHSVELVYDADVAGGQIDLYQVRDSGGPRNVTGFSVSGNVVTLDVQGKLKSGAQVTYGLARTPGAGWLTDLAGTAVACFENVPVTP